MKKTVAFVLVTIPFTFSLAACQQRLTAEEARIAADESALSSQAEELTSSSVELTVETDFTLGQAVEDAAEQIRGFVTAQLPCAEVTRSAGTVSIEYGKLSGDCTWKGHVYSGKHTVKVEKVDDQVVLVNHSWEDFTNGAIEVDGSADVTWDFEDRSRRVVHEMSWTRRSDGRTGTGTGDRTMRALGGDIFDGIEVEGSRRWEGESGTWNMTINDVQWRWQDPVPQAGSYSLDTPFDKSVSMGFDRVDDSTIAVTLEGPQRRSFTFNVRKTGGVSGS